MNLLLMLWRVFRQEGRTLRDFFKAPPDEIVGRWAEKWKETT